MNIYDFDNTIYDGDTNKDLIFYSIKRYPIKVLKSIFRAKKIWCKYKNDKIPFSKVKESLLSFLFQIDNVDEYLDIFVDKNLNKIKTWYLNSKKENDIIISASYEIWISKFCKKLGIKYFIATKTDKNGKIIGNNCKGIEKINRLKKEFPDYKINCAYSDSKSDIPMLEYAKKSYVVDKDNLIPYKKGIKFKNNG